MSPQDNLVISAIDNSPLNRGLSGAEWLADPANRAAVFRNGDMILFEDTGDQIFDIHFLFEKARGATAILQTKLAFHDAFTKFGARAIMGSVPVENAKARIFSRLVGGKSAGIHETEHGSCEKFVLTLDMWKAK